MNREREIHVNTRAFRRIDGEDGHIVIDNGVVFSGRILGRDFEIGSEPDRDSEIRSKYKQMLEQGDDAA